ncbi:unnamed protein product [Toxocara canis]|uniref:Core-2/I-Branching enzyme n=1 Tax=Toxocara canis TaxID=6265 RepID=A0A183V3G7_TOXCA|nr:unnamed protein product [Toxocara canis]
MSRRCVDVRLQEFLLGRLLFKRIPSDRLALRIPSLLLNGYLDSSRCRRAVVDNQFAVAVAKDYFVQEVMLNVMYAPQNEYCYIIDSKASMKFHAMMRNLSRCFPNVHISDIEYVVDSAGNNMTRSLLQCLCVLLKRPHWKYVFLLQNHDFLLKTNAELVKILSVFNGSNDVEMKELTYGALRGVRWKFSTLNLFRDDRSNDNRHLRFAKGGVQSVFSRESVDYIINKLNLTLSLSKLDKLGYGNDELLLPTLNMQDEIGVPGGFTRRCIGNESFHTTKFAVWAHMSGCSSNAYRHNVCIFGIEDLQMLMNQDRLIANKMLPEFDYSAFSCWMQILFNLTHGMMQRRLNLDLYARLPHVRFNRQRERWSSNITAFDCTYH